MAKKISLRCLFVLKCVFMSFGFWYADTSWQKRYLKIGLCYTIILLTTSVITIFVELASGPLSNQKTSIKVRHTVCT